MLEVRDLHSYYGEAHVLAGVSLDVPAGRIVALLGRNGMGKTTLIRSIMGLAPPEVRAGSVRYRGEELRGLPPHRIAQKRIGLVPQGRRLFASLTVMEHLTAMRSRRKDSAWSVARIFELFPRLGERRQHRGSQLSGGERQMLAIARALMVDPTLLLLDEPSEGLAPLIVEKIVHVLHEVKGKGLTILLIEQNLGTALKLADRHYVLSKGEICYSGTSGELEGNEEVKKKYLGV